MSIRFEFDWDPAKAASNVVKHGVTFDDAMQVFADPLALSRPDNDQTGREQRWITIGLTRAARAVLVVHTHVEISADHVYVRIISARRPTKREQRQYEQAPD